MKYKWDEDKYLKEALEYINKTYTLHYAGNGEEKDVMQFTEYFAEKNSLEEVIAAFKFNVQKYAERYGKKKGYNREDLLKVIHYSIMMLAVVDKNK